MIPFQATIKGSVLTLHSVPTFAICDVVDYLQIDQFSCMISDDHPNEYSLSAPMNKFMMREYAELIRRTNKENEANPEPPKAS